MLIRKKENVEVLISILTEIMFRNPRVIPQSVGIISILLKELNIEKKIKVIDNIQNKLSSIPNIGFLEIWLQRLRYPIKKDNKFDNKLFKNVSGNHDSIWNIDWIK
jgi:RNA-directed DNA polymerase